MHANTAHQKHSTRNRATPLGFAKTLCKSTPCYTEGVLVKGGKHLQGGTLKNIKVQTFLGTGLYAGCALIPATVS